MFRKLSLFIALGLAGFGTASAQQRGPLVLAAASLQETMTEAADVWAARKHAMPVVSFAGSPALARQIESGAPADIFVSADEEWMNYVAGKGLIRAGSRVSFLSNQLVLIAPASSRARLTIGRNFPLARALGTGRLAMADPDAVPAGKYGKAALENLGIWTSVQGKIARAENVRAAMALVERGEAPFGIVYATDARASTRVRVIGTFPANSHPAITYPIAILKASTSPDAEGFRRFLLSRDGKAIFTRRGFTTR
ncbi:MAG: molybdate ABC transporter substrate-binding protein [Novosphingobium sp.]